MNDFLRTLTHARRLKSVVKELGIEQLEVVKNKLQKIIEDRKAEEEAALLENKERLEKIRQYQEMLAKEGIDPNELQETDFYKQAKRAPRKPKYELWNEFGKHITWTGQGRMPNVFKERIEGGESIDTFLID